MWRHKELQNDTKENDTQYKYVQHNNVSPAFAEYHSIDSMLSFFIVLSYVVLSVDKLKCNTECRHCDESCESECLKADLFC
jgi:hypothetical protein